MRISGVISAAAVVCLKTEKVSLFTGSTKTTTKTPDESGLQITAKKTILRAMWRDYKELVRDLFFFSNTRLNKNPSHIPVGEFRISISAACSAKLFITSSMKKRVWS